MSLTHTNRRVTSAGCNFRNGPCCWPLYADGWIIHAPTKHATHSSSIGNAQGLPQMYANASFAATAGACLDATHTCQFEGRAVPATTCTCTYVSNHMMPFPLIVAGWLVDGNPQSAIRTIWNYLVRLGSGSLEHNYGNHLGVLLHVAGLGEVWVVGCGRLDPHGPLKGSCATHTCVSGPTCHSQSSFSVPMVAHNPFTAARRRARYVGAWSHPTANCVRMISIAVCASLRLDRPKHFNEKPKNQIQSWA
mgnify:CR=1 FL=1